ncbi:AAA family ATPase [bacterium]|nr:AAA family ATPase [bacterium]
MTGILLGRVSVKSKIYLRFSTERWYALTMKEKSNHTIEVKLIFSKSSSKNYSKSIKLSKIFDNFKSIEDGNDSNILVLSKNEIGANSKNFRALWDIVGSWKSTQIYINDELKSFREMIQLMSVLECVNTYHNTLIPEKHCTRYMDEDNWGCKYLVSINRQVRHYCRSRKDYSYWYDFGEFVSANKWKIDKSRLRDLLHKEVKLRMLEFCEVLKVENIDKAIANLPDVIDLNQNDDWEIIYEDYSEGDVIKKKGIGINPKSKNDYSFEIGRSIGRADDNNEELKKGKNRNIPEITFDDIGGIDSIIQIIREVIELPLKNAALIKHMGIKPHRGILLYGPPGCGKTLLAKAIANEVNAHFISIKGPELLNKYWGQSEEALREIFETARDMSPTIIYFDEIDSIGQKRSGEENVRHYSVFLNQLLSLMDGIETYGNTTVIGSTNRRELLDAALLRPGRFDYSIKVDVPNFDGCYKIFSIHTEKMPLSEKVDIKKLSNKLIGLSGAEIAFIASEGAYNCLRRCTNASDLLKENVNKGAFDNIQIEYNTPHNLSQVIR